MGQRWVVVPGTIRAIAEADAGVAERIFGSSDAIVLGGWPGATTGQAWASYAQFADDVETGSIPEDVRVAMYDPENWEPTPLAERLDPLGSIEAFCALARSHGYFVLITPHANLVSVPESIHAPRAGETREEAFLRSGIVEVSALNADAIETLEHPRPPRRGHHRARRASPGGRPPLGGSNPRAHSVLYEPRTLTAASSGVIFRVVMTSSTTPYSTAPSAVRMKSRSVSLDTRSRGWPVWKAISSSRSRR